MDINIKIIFERANMKNLRRFLLTGRDLEDEEDYRTYQEHLDFKSEAVIYDIKRIYKDDEDNEKFAETMDNLSTAFAAYRNVFTEVGMKIGAKLMFQLLCEDE